jgi:hypothetical protein
MLSLKTKMAIGVALFCAAPAVLRAQNEQQAYCAYVMEQAQAQRDLLRTPTGVAGFTQPETGLPTQVVAGATLGLADVRKASLTIDVARKDCQLYKVTTAAQQSVQYALAGLEKQALVNRLTLIDRASRLLDVLLEQTAKMLEVQNATRMMLFTLQTTRIKLDADRADTQSKITALYVPSLSDQPLKEVIAQKQSSEDGRQRVFDKLTRQNNWNVALTVGVHQQINPIAQGTQPYGMVSINYNLASRAIDRHLDRAAEAHEDWKKFQESDVVRQVEVLRQQLLDTISVQEAKLKSLQTETQQVEQSLQAVASPDTAAALDFHNQLSATQLLLQIETGDTAYRLDRLHEYLASNY